ncbi:MAG: hypothetical protein R2874_15695 [Desulfobacterales bacterium]
MIDHVNGEKKKSGFIWIRTAALLKRPKTPVTAMIRQRPWYQKAFAERAIIWTDPYIFFSSQKPGITVSGPIFKANGQLQSIVGWILKSMIVLFISRLRIGKHGRALMLNNNGDVVAFPISQRSNRAKVLQPTTSEWLKSMNWTMEVSRAAFHAIQWPHTETGLLKLDHSQFAKFTCNGEVYNTMFISLPTHTGPG